MQALNNKAGVYGSPCSSGLNNFPDVPDAIWLAHWIYDSYNANASVWGVACMSDGYWPNHQRIRQYTGAHNETWGGATINIDSNVLDGVIAIPSGSNVVVNDDIDFAEEIGALPYLDLINTANAGSAGDDPAFSACFRQNGRDTVWYQFIPDRSGVIVIDTPGSDYDTMLAVWKGSPGKLTLIGSCNDDIDGTLQSSVAVDVLVGTTYYVEIAAYNGVIGGEPDVKPIASGLHLHLRVREGSKAAFTSAGAYDGWVLESTETSGRGGSTDSISTMLYAGDDAENKQYCSILSFDTAALPDTLIAYAAKVTLKKAAVIGASPFTTHGRLMLDIKTGLFGTPGLQRGDFQSPATRSDAGRVSGGLSTYSAWLNFVVEINPAGTTQLRLCFDTDDDNDSSADIFGFYSGNASSTSARPKLTVYYYLP
jgi:hypothetical protein